MLLSILIGSISDCVEKFMVVRTPEQGIGAVPFQAYQVRGEMGVGYGTLHRFLERRIDKVRALRYHSNKMEFEELLKCRSIGLLMFI